METFRSFIAIGLPDEIKAELGQLQALFKNKEQNWIRWVNPDSIHLTLKFLGDTAVDKTGEILNVMEESIYGIPPFYLQIKGMGVFPNLKRIRIIWVGITGDIENLQRIQNNVETNLSIFGYPAEEREFTPHLTLGRVRFQISPAEQQKFAGLFTTIQFESAYKINVDSISLMKSQLTSNGAIYSKVGTVSLKKLS